MARLRPDRQELFQAYVEMGDSRSYQRLAERFHVAKHTIVKIAVKNEWMARLRLIEAEARRDADKKLVDARKEAHERHLKYAKLIQGRAVQGLQAHQFDNARDSAKALVEGVKLERTTLGEPSESQAVTVQALTRREVESFVTGSLFPDEDMEAEAEVREDEDDDDPDDAS